MTPWRTVGSVIAGASVTLVLNLLALVLLPVFGFVTAQLVGDWVPVWLFLAPSILCVVGGGATAGFLSGRPQEWCAALGGLAGALGVTAIGILLGLGFLVLLLGMTPAHGQETNLSKLTLTMVSLGGGAGFVVGAVLGATGGLIGHLGRAELTN